MIETATLKQRARWSRDHIRIASKHIQDIRRLNGQKLSGPERGQLKKAVDELESILAILEKVKR